jgi:CRISPR-associated exonuclease Cas4
MFSEDELLPIAALQHLAFCERQWGLMYLEQIWADNRLTAEGLVEHQRVDSADTESRGTLRTVHALRLRSLRLGLTGRADACEFHLVDDAGEGVHLDGVEGLWRPFPVEHKHGRPKLGVCDEVQLCAQALCLEEMLGIVVPAGALFYGKPRRRANIALTAELRAETERLASRLHEMTRLAVTPGCVYESKCESCSLLIHCMPKSAGARRGARDYLDRAVSEILDGRED